MAQVIALAGSGARPTTRPLSATGFDVTNMAAVESNMFGTPLVQFWCGHLRLSQALLLPRLTSGRSRRAEGVIRVAQERGASLYVASPVIDELLAGDDDRMSIELIASRRSSTTR